VAAPSSETDRLLPPARQGDRDYAPTDTDAYDAYISDPASPVPYQGGVIRRRTDEYMIDDQRFAAARRDVLTYQTAPLPLTSPWPAITADLYVSTSTTDADFVVKAVDVFPTTLPANSQATDVGARRSPARQVPQQLLQSIPADALQDGTRRL